MPKIIQQNRKNYFTPELNPHSETDKTSISGTQNRVAKCSRTKNWYTKRPWLMETESDSDTSVKSYRDKRRHSITESDSDTSAKVCRLTEKKVMGIGIQKLINLLVVLNNRLGTSVLLKV